MCQKKFCRKRTFKAFKYITVEAGRREFRFRHGTGFHHAISNRLFIQFVKFKDRNLRPLTKNRSIYISTLTSKNDISEQCIKGNDAGTSKGETYEGSSTRKKFNIKVVAAPQLAR